MNKAATINMRIESSLKHHAEDIFHKIGLSTAEAIRIFYTQVCLKNGLPFEVKLPSQDTLEAIHELESGQGSRYTSMNDVWREIEAD